MYKVLIVDDEDILANGLKWMIESISHEFEVIGICGNGIDAFEFITENEIDVLITDIKMPMLSGSELIKRVAENYQDIEYVVISGYGEFETAQEVMQYGVRYYLLKPYNRDKLLFTMDRIKKNLDKIKSDGKNELEQESMFAVKHSKWIRHIIQYVAEHLADSELSLKKIASQELFVNVGYLSRIFNKEMNESFPRYVIKMRVKKAQELIDDLHDDRIYEIAEKIGFGDNPQYFSQIFKNNTGYTPTEYRLRDRMNKIRA